VKELKIGDLIYIKQYKCAYIICAASNQLGTPHGIILTRLGKMSSSDKTAYVCGINSALFNNVVHMQGELTKGNIVYLGNLADTVEKAVKKVMK
jgi:hypothetical protein